MDLILYFYFLENDSTGRLVNPNLSSEFGWAQMIEMQESYDNLKALLLDAKHTNPETAGWKYQIRRIIQHPCIFNPRLSEEEILEKLPEIGDKSIEHIKKFLRRVDWELDQITERTFEFTEQKRAVALALEYCEELKKRLADGGFAAYRIWNFVKMDNDEVDYKARERFFPKAENESKTEESLFETLKSQAREHLQILDGHNVYVRKIMLDADYKRLCDYVEAMIEKNGLPDGLEPIMQIDFPNTHIRYLFYQIHAKLYTTKEIKGYFIDFIHAVFKQFTGKKETTKAKFSEKPSSWDEDLEKMIR